jgi:hypothetical protein
MLVSGTQDRGFAPDGSRRIFPAGKIHSMPSFGRGSKIICPMLVTLTTKRSKRSKTVNYGTKKNPGGGEIFRTQPPVQWIPGPGVKRPGRGVDHPPPLSTEVENE